MARNGVRSWKLRSHDDVRRLWRQVRHVPSRIDGRKHYHEEQYCLGLYLLALSEHGRLAYPLSIEQGESPDFVFEWSSGEASGLEVTRTTVRWLQREMTRMEKEYRRREIEAARHGARAEPVSMLLSAAGWAGDRAEEEWCGYVCETIRQKSGKLRKYHSLGYCDLLIYDEAPVGGVKREKVLPVIRSYVRRLKTTPAFRKISLIMSMDVIFDVGGECSVLPYIDWQSPRLRDRQDFVELAERVEDAGRAAVERQAPSYTREPKGRIVKQMPDERRFAVRPAGDGENVLSRKLARG